MRKSKVAAQRVLASTGFRFCLRWYYCVMQLMRGLRRDGSGGHEFNCETRPHVPPTRPHVHTSTRDSGTHRIPAFPRREIYLQSNPVSLCMNVTSRLQPASPIVDMTGLRRERLSACPCNIQSLKSADHMATYSRCCIDAPQKKTHLGISNGWEQASLRQVRSFMILR
ncbi:hypothetical protein BGX38DRAFT_1181476 [Terfezia claveryi]|nr:hypothetical protein BGX38DRAFT_1181476 [Terfezia claveryi]